MGMDPITGTIQYDTLGEPAIIMIEHQYDGFVKL